MAPSQLMEELLIERVALLTAARRHENVASDELVNNFTVSRYAAEGDVHVPFKLDGHLFYVPVHVPLLHVVVAPCLHHVTHSQVDTDQAVGSYAKHLVLSATLKPDNHV